MTLLFVYGTLQPGQPRWPVLEPFVDRVLDDTAAVPGHLYRSPYGWPAAVFGHTAILVPGHVVALRAASEPAALRLLDEVEGVTHGLFERTIVHTTNGTACLAYCWPHATHEMIIIRRWRESSG